jgi:hypothetical protein
MLWYHPHKKGNTESAGQHFSGSQNTVKEQLRQLPFIWLISRTILFEWIVVCVRIFIRKEESYTD